MTSARLRSVVIGWWKNYIRQRHTIFFLLFITVLSFYIMSFLDTFHTFQMLCKYKLETQQ